MSISQRKFRVDLYDFVRGGGTSNGRVASQYRRVASSSTSGKWWAAKTNPSGREATSGMKAEHRLDVIFTLSARAPVTEAGLIALDGTFYYVRWMGERDYGHDEVQVYGERVERTPVIVP